MRAVTVLPGSAGSLDLDDVPEPDPADGDVLVDVLAVGLCGTDQEIVSGAYGQAPPGQDHLVLGHESLGRVRSAPPGAGVSAGDLVVGIVRRPDPVPCEPCAAGQWDMCRNGRYTEHGIKGLDGFMRERYRAAPNALVRVDPSLGLCGVLLEPTSIVAKAWAEIDRIGMRSVYRPRTALVTGAGPVGLLAALLGVRRGLEVHVLDRVTGGPKPALVSDLGATYHTTVIEDLDLSPDIVVECTGAAPVVLGAILHSGTDSVVCLTGVSAPGRRRPVDLGRLNRDLVLENTVVFGSVNARREHYEAAATALAEADGTWLERLITRQVPLDDYRAAFHAETDDVKAVLRLSADPGLS